MYWLAKIQKLSARRSQEPLIIMFSDQGTQYGFFGTTVQAEYENVLPFGFIRMPPSLKAQYPSWYENLKENAHRLTSHLDIYPTLEDILHLSYLDENGTDFKFKHLNWENSPNRSAYSFFEPIPDTRTCESALIPQENCPCGLDIHDAIGEGRHEIAKNLTDRMFNLMNGYLRDEIKKNVCVPLEPEELTYLRTIRNGTLKDISSEGGQIRYSEYTLGVVVKYSGATYDGFARVMDNGKILMDDRSIRLMTPVPGQSSCLPAHEYQEYCMCRDYY